MPLEEFGVCLSQGLQGRDDQIDLLVDLFEQSQTATVETANPMLDLISFAQACTEFWLIDVDDARLTSVRNLNEEEFIFTNSLGLYPSDPLGSIEPTSGPLKPNQTTTKPLDRNISNESQQQSSSHPNSLVLSGETTGTNATLQGRTLRPSPQPFPSTFYIGDNFRHSSDISLAGFIYLLPSSTYPDALHFQEYVIGIVLLPEWRNRGVAARTLYSVIDLAFSKPNVHRIQAQLIDCYKNIQALRLFTRMGFSHEGTRRQSFECPLTAEWKDVTTLAIVVTDWYIHIRDRNGFWSAPLSLWDVLFTRHQQEREELLRWEDRLSHQGSSMKTISEAATTPVPRASRLADLSDSEDGTTSESGSALIEQPERERFEIGINWDLRRDLTSDGHDASSSEYESECDSAAFGSPSKSLRSRLGGPSSATASALPLAIGIALDSLAGQKPLLTSQTSSGKHVDCQDLPISMLREGALTLIHVQSPSPSPSPKLDMTSAVTSPLLDSDSEFELEDGGCMTSSGTSLCAIDWELVDHDDASKPNLH